MAEDQTYAPSDIAQRVQDVLARAESEAVAIRARAAEDARAYELRAQAEADRLLRRRAVRLREVRESVRGRSERLEDLLRAFADGLAAGTDRVLWAAATADRSDQPTISSDPGRKLSASGRVSADEGDA